MSRKPKTSRAEPLVESASESAVESAMESAPSAAPDDTIIARALPAYLSNAQQAAGAGLLGEQAVWLQAALMLDPALTDARLDLIDLLINRGALDPAIAMSTELVEREPQNALALWHLGYALQLAARHAEAIPFYRRAHAIDPSVPTLRNNLAVALELSGQPDEAMPLLEEAVAADPNDIEAWTNLARVYPRRMELEHALAAGKRAVQIDPSNSLAQSNYSLALKEAQRWEEATAASVAAMQLAPESARFSFNLSLLDLLQRNYSRGWEGFEARWDGSTELAGSHPQFNVPRWNGESLEGKTVLLWGEQGFGDALQFCRFAPMLANQVEAAGGKLVWAVFNALHPLLARTAPKNVACYAHDAALPLFDFHFPLQSLPRFFAIDESSIPAQRGYLAADPERANAWRSPADKHLRVGVVWTGSATHQRNAFRAIGIDRLAKALGSLDNVALFSLQKGAEEDVAAARAQGVDIADHTAEFATFDDTAAFIESLDLVVTVCTSIAHLAAALGKPTWVLLDVNPHWMWQLERADSPWYPSATLYRQKHFGQWDPVMAQVSADLRALAAKHASSGEPKAGQPKASAPKRRVPKKAAAT